MLTLIQIGFVTLGVAVDAEHPRYSATAVGETAASVKTLYVESCVDEAGFECAHIEALTDQMTRLYDLDVTIKKLGDNNARAEDLLHVRSERYRAAAWLQGWAIFSNLTRKISLPNHELTDAERAHARQLLLPLTHKAEERPSSALGLLLAIYSQMVEGNNVFPNEISMLRVAANRTSTKLLERLVEERDSSDIDRLQRELVAAVARQRELSKWLAMGRETDPVRLRLRDGVYLSILLGEDWPLLTADEAPPARIEHHYYLPSASEIVGKPSDELGDNRPIEQRRLLSLWTLVNLQLDTWREQINEAQQDDKTHAKLGMATLADWLEDLVSTKALNAFDEAGAGNAANGLRLRIAKLYRFVRFRDQTSDPGTLCANMIETTASSFITVEGEEVGDDGSIAGWTAGGDSGGAGKTAAAAV